MNSADERDYILTERGTGRYADLHMVQAVALPAVAQALVTALRAGTDKGRSQAGQGVIESHDDRD